MSHAMPAAAATLYKYIKRRVHMYIRCGFVAVIVRKGLFFDDVFWRSPSQRLSYL